MSQPPTPPAPTGRPPLDRGLLWLAEGLGSGRLRPGPGTWGSVVGLLWTALLIATGSPWIYAGGTVAGIAFAIWACGRAEVLLGRHDPSSVVLDELAAVPVCFVPWLVSLSADGGFPSLPAFLATLPGWAVPAAFATFRLFDILKPWPINRIQRLPGGWGIVADDVMAALWVALLTLLVVA